MTDGERCFPLLDQGRSYRDVRSKPYPRGVPWSFLVPHEAQAIENHDQTLERLAQRGGLVPQEMVAVLENRRWRGRTDERDSFTDDDALARIKELLETDGLAFIGRRTP